MGSPRRALAGTRSLQTNSVRIPPLPALHSRTSVQANSVTLASSTVDGSDRFRLPADDMMVNLVRTLRTRKTAPASRWF